MKIRPVEAELFFVDGQTDTYYDPEILHSMSRIKICLV
jgi:hypothetical protein